MKQETKKAPPSPTAEIKSNVTLIERAVSTLEPRFTLRVLRTLTTLRKKLDDKVLRDAIESIFPSGQFTLISRCLYLTVGPLDSLARKQLLSWLPPASTTDHTMDIDTAPGANSPKSPPSEPLPEAEIYLRLLLIHHLTANDETKKKAIELSLETVEEMQALNRRSMDPIAAKVWYAVERAYELGANLADARP